MTTPQDPNYQDQGALDQPQQGTDPQPGAYETPGVVPPEQQAPLPESDNQPQVAGGGAAPRVEEATPEPSPGTTPAPSTPARPATVTTTSTATAPQAPTPAPAPPAGGSDS